MADSDSLSRQQQLQQQIMMNARQQQMQMTAARQHEQQKQQQQTMGRVKVTHLPSSQAQAQGGIMGSNYDDLTVDPNDLSRSPASIASFESACQHGPLSTVQSIVSSSSSSSSFLHHGLVRALAAGRVEIARWILSVGAPLVRQTPDSILSAPLDQQIPLFELLTHYGWTPNTPGYYGAVLPPHVVTNLPLLTWFLDHGANPNLGAQRDNRDRIGGPDTDSCTTLETAAAKGNVEAVRILLDAGAELRNGVPLHFAAGACPPGTNPHANRVTPSKEFDTSRIPIMELLVERGAVVNQVEESRHMVARYAVVHAVMAGAVERVKWLLEKGADPEARGAWGSAIECAQSMGSEEMKRVVNSAKR